VTFLKDGKLIHIPLDQLSDEDRKVIRDLEAENLTGVGAAAENGRAGRAIEPAAPAAGSSGGDRLLAAGKKKIVIADRVWTNTQGNQTTAKFVRVAGGNVVLLRGNRTVTLPFDSLTSADQDYVREVLISRGEEALIPPSASTPAEPPAAAPEAADPPPASTPVAPQPAPSDDGPTLGRGNSSIFDKMRERDQQTREQHAQQAAQAGQPLADHLQPTPADNLQQRPDAQPEALQSSPAVAPQPPLATAEPAATRGSRGVHTTLDPAMAKEIWGSAIIVVVAVGVIGTIGLVVFVAISIAAASNTSRRRRYTS